MAPPVERSPDHHLGKSSGPGTSGSGSPPVASGASQGRLQQSASTVPSTAAHIHEQRSGGGSGSGTGPRSNMGSNRSNNGSGGNDGSGAGNQGSGNNVTTSKAAAGGVDGNAAGAAAETGHHPPEQGKPGSNGDGSAGNGSHGNGSHGNGHTCESQRTDFAPVGSLLPSVDLPNKEAGAAPVAIAADGKAPQQSCELRQPAQDAGVQPADAAAAAAGLAKAMQ